MKLQNYLKVLVMVIALTFTTNSNASTIPLTWGSWSSWITSLLNGGGSSGGSNDDDSSDDKHDDDSSDDNNDDNSSGDHHDDNSSGGKPGDDGGKSVPLDGGLGFLLLGAAAFGVKKLRGNKNETI